MDKRALIGLLSGSAAFAATLVFDPPLAGLSAGAWRTFGLAVMMASWWISECVPIPVTSFLPIILAPAVGVAPLKEVTASYGHPLIFLFLGGFVLSLAIERTGLHERIARIVVVAAGSDPRRQIGGLMAVTAGLSMWISNTATAVIMLPIALSMARRSAENLVYGRGLLLGVAYGASIGGMATLVGTPPNAMLAAYLESAYGYSIGFGRWMLLGVPFSLVLLAAAWALLTWRLRGAAAICDAADEVRAQLQRMGRLTTAERRVGIVFVLTALAWMGREALVSLSGIDISDTGIAMAAALALFLAPSDAWNGPRVLDWPQMQRLPWGILLLFGGGLALATMMSASGLADFIGGAFGRLDGIHSLWAVAVIALTVVFLTEITSNTATTASLLPLVGPIAIAFGEAPSLLAIPTALAASCAFMLPVATPPNAIVFSSGSLRVSEMARAGLALNVVSVVLLTLIAWWPLPTLFGP